MPIQKQLLICLLTFWLASCTTLPSNQAPSQDKKQQWDSRAQTLSSIQHWDLKALVAIQNTERHIDWTANLQWMQKPNHYTILLFGPLGTGAVKLTGSSGNVKLETADGKVFSAATPELLMSQQTDWSLPVSNLYYWIRGLPVPNIPAQKQFDTYHHLTELRQEGWRIQYLRYTSVNNIDIPNKIFLFNPTTRVKIVVNAWNI